MNWPLVRQLFWRRGERSILSLLVVGAAVWFGAWIRDAYHSSLLGLAVALTVWGLYDLLDYYFVRRKRASAEVPPNQRL